MELNQSLALSTPANPSLGRFARLIQATYLLGKVLNHVTDSVVDEAFYEEVTSQLDRTLRSLIHVSGSGENGKQVAFCAQISICYRSVLSV